jgi:hypothetical protein
MHPETCVLGIDGGTQFVALDLHGYVSVGDVSGRFINGAG